MLESKEYYNRIASKYRDQSHSRDAYLSGIDHLIAKYIPNPSRGLFMDIGAGDGVRIKKLQERLNIRQLALVEQSDILFEKAHKELPQAKIYYDDFIQANIPTGSVACAFALWNVLGHVGSASRFFEKAWDVLQENGTLIFDVNNRYNIQHYGLLAVVRNYIKSVFRSKRSGYFLIGSEDSQSWVYIFSKREIVGLLKKSGFNIEKIFFVDYATGDVVANSFRGQIFVVAKKMNS